MTAREFEVSLLVSNENLETVFQKLIGLGVKLIKIENAEELDPEEIPHDILIPDEQEQPR